MPRRSAGARPHWGALVLTALPALGRILIARKFPLPPTALLAKEGEASPRAHLPPSPSRHSVVRVPRNDTRREPPTGGVWQRHFSPRCPAAACGNRDKAPTTTTSDDTHRSIVGRKLSVRKRTFFARLYSSDRGAAVLATNSPMSRLLILLSRFECGIPPVLGARGSPLAKGQRPAANTRSALQ